MPEGVAPLGPGVGEEGNSLSVPPLTEKPLIASAPESTTQSVEPSGVIALHGIHCALPAGVSLVAELQVAPRLSEYA